jgi:hypothetical protein
MSGVAGGAADGPLGAADPMPNLGPARQAADAPALKETPGRPKFH